jgi:hypothetical protein
MSEPQFTPGEWEYDEIANPFFNDAEGNSRGGDGSGFYEVFTNVEIDHGDGDIETDTILLVEKATLADSRLFRASKHLYAAVEAAWEFCGDEYRTPAEFAAMYERLKDALAKARGDA